VNNFWQYLPGIIAAIFAGIAAVIGAINHNNVKALDIKVDGRLTQLLQQTAIASHSTGMIEGRNGGTAK
jgi:hypothetical protein